MTREDAKELLPVIQAFAEGKEIEYYSFDGTEHSWEAVPSEMNFDEAPEYYRIKKEPKYRPFETVEECWQEMQKHQPLGWLKDFDAEDKYQQVVCMDIDEEGSLRVYAGGEIDTAAYFLKLYGFADGTPFGVKEG